MADDPRADSGAEGEAFWSMATGSSFRRQAIGPGASASEKHGDDRRRSARGRVPIEANLRPPGASSNQRRLSVYPRLGNIAEKAIATQKTPRTQPVTFVQDQFRPARPQRQPARSTARIISPIV